MRILIIGNPENRRVEMFREELLASQSGEPLIFSHEELIRNPERLLEIPDEPILIRIDSTGENPRTERLLLERGYEAASALPGVWSMDPKELSLRPERFGEVLCPKQRHLGFEDYINSLQKIFELRPSWKILNPPSDLLEFFDKQRLMEKYAAAGIATPPALPPVSHPEEFRAALRESGFSSVFVKLTSGSSASCLGIYTRQGHFITTLLRRNESWFNSLKLQRLTRPERVDEALAFLLSEGSRVEQNIPKARLEGSFFDLRMLAIDGSVDFYVVRQSSHPITNLHLGGSRGDGALFEAAIGAAVLEETKKLVLKAYSLHGTFQMGADVMLEPGFKNPRIIESNAFGDLLPNLTHGGETVYGRQIRLMKERYRKIEVSLLPQDS